MKKARELKPCPFCGRNSAALMRAAVSVNGSVNRERLGDFFVYWVECPQCLARLPGTLSKPTAIDAWNRAGRA
jgi:Lar family restriction alleviation protein